jgi:hypothetical protein
MAQGIRRKAQGMRGKAEDRGRIKKEMISQLFEIILVLEP